MLEQNHHHLAFASSFSIPILLLYFLDVSVGQVFLFLADSSEEKNKQLTSRQRSDCIKFAQNVCGRGGEGQSMAPIRGCGYVGPELLFRLNGDLKVVKKVVNFHFLLLINGKSFTCYKKE